jgi:glycine hydroxymethyltransferase
MTMRGLDEDDFREIGAIMCAAIKPDADLSALRARSAELVDRRPLYPGLPAFPSFGG